MRNIKLLNKTLLMMVLGAFLLASCDKPIDSTSSSDTSSDTSTETSTSTSTATDTSTNTSTSTSSDTSGGSDHYEMPSQYATYYSSLSSNPTSTQLRSLVNVKNLYSYDGVRDAMYLTDRDWKLSPNSSETNPYMNLIYASYNGSTSTAYKRSDYTTVWDREHIWPQSRGGFNTSTGPGTDMHHLRASDKNNNSTRGNKDFDNVSSGNYVKDYRSQNSGYYSGDRYMPMLQYRGDVARACFYMSLVYPSNCPLIESTPGSGISLGKLSVLLQWHELDPVDEFEMKRNNIIYDSYQHNRNPFIDHPEWAHSIF